MRMESERPSPDWKETADYWYVDLPARSVGPRDIPVSAVTYRVYRRESPPSYVVRVWSAGKEVPDWLPEEFRTFDSLEAATDSAEGWSNHDGPYDGVIGGFFAQRRSNVDGDRFLIIDERDYDMTGWSVVVRDDSHREAWTPSGSPPIVATHNLTERIRTFDRADGWYSYGGRFYHDGYGDSELRYPWTALCDHGEEVVRFLPPASAARG
jgi:hypothetical protein